MECCPACGASWSPAGDLKVKASVADPMLVGPLANTTTLRYARCGHCSTLIATDARREPGVLDAIYAAMSDEYWEQLGDQDVFSRTLDETLRARVPQGDLWDVGCGDGALLQRLGDGWRKHGIEPGERAAAEARAQGLDVRAGTASLLALSEVADALILVDVVEHLLDPREELAAAYRMLRPGGVMAVFSGVADALFPRLAGENWYYLQCVGHVSVFSRPALSNLLAELGLNDVQSHRIEHPGAVTLTQWLRRVAGNGARALLRRPPAQINFYRDHQLILGSKPGAE